MLDALRISEACSINAKISDFKNRNITIQKEEKTLANYSNIKPTLPSYREYLKKNEISIESNSIYFLETSSLGHISRKRWKH
jgi:hypothetical protein